MGTNIGAAPTFAIPLKKIDSPLEKAQILEYSNWNREQMYHLIFRLKPERAIKLFGDGVSELQKSFQDSAIGITKKYILMGNMVAPEVGKNVAELFANS